MRTIASLRPFPMSAGNFVGNTIEKVAVLPISIPPRKKYLVYSLFTWGEGAPVRTLGRMRGRFGTQPFLVEKGGSPGRRLNEVFLLLRWASRSPPHPSPSVTASPKGKPSQVVHLHNEMLSPPTPTPAKCESKSGHIDGPRNRPTTAPLRPTTPKRASGNERALKKGGAGATPRDSLRPGFL